MFREKIMQNYDENSSSRTVNSDSNRNKSGEDLVEEGIPKKKLRVDG